MDGNSVKRLYVGGLADDVTRQDLEDRFGKYATINSVDIRSKKNEEGETVNTFAFLDVVSPQQKLQQCIATYNNTKWKGKVLRLQLAKESFLDRLAEERKNNLIVQPWSPTLISDEVSAHEKIREIKVKGPPGTTIDNMKDWVVGKYGRVLPILNLRKKEKSTDCKFDPSKHCHLLHNFDGSKIAEGVVQPKIEDLTWQIQENRKETSVPERARKAEQPRVKSKQKQKLKTLPKFELDDSSSDSSNDEERQSHKVIRSGRNIGQESSESSRWSCDVDNSSCDTDEIIKRGSEKGSGISKEVEKAEVGNLVPDLGKKRKRSGDVVYEIVKKDPVVKLGQETKLGQDTKLGQVIGLNKPAIKKQELDVQSSTAAVGSRTSKDGPLKNKNFKSEAGNKVTKVDKVSEIGVDEVGIVDMESFQDCDSDDSAGSADTDEIISRLARKFSPIVSGRKSINLETVDEYSDGEAYNDVDGCKKASADESGSESDDDIFDLIGSGKIDLLVKRGRSKPWLVEEEGKNNLKVVQKDRTEKVKKTKIDEIVSSSATVLPVKMPKEKKVMGDFECVGKNKSSGRIENVAVERAESRLDSNLQIKSLNGLEDKAKEVPGGKNNVATEKIEEVFQGKRKFEEVLLPAVGEGIKKRKLENSSSKRNCDALMSARNDESLLKKKELSNLKRLESLKTKKEKSTD